MMQNLKLTCYVILAVLTKTFGVELLPWVFSFNKKTQAVIYLLTSSLMYFLLSQYIGYLDFSVVFITLTGACLCIQIFRCAFKDNLMLSGVKLLGVCMVILGGIISIIFNFSNV